MIGVGRGWRQVECAEVKFLGGAPASVSTASLTSVNAASGNCLPDREIRGRHREPAEPEHVSSGLGDPPGSLPVTLLTTDQRSHHYAATRRCGSGPQPVRHEILPAWRPTDNDLIQPVTIGVGAARGVSTAASAHARRPSGTPAIAAPSRAARRKAGSPAHGFRPEIRSRHDDAPEHADRSR